MMKNLAKDSAVSLLLLLSLFLVTVPASVSPPARAQIANGIVASNYSVSTAENTSVKINVLANDYCLLSGLQCPDGTYVQSVTQPSTGVAVINPDNTVTYTPNNGFVGSDSFTYTASDTLNLFTGTGTVSVTVNPPGTSQGGITVTANRVQASYWDPCFATTCSAGSGPGTTMYFALCADASCVNVVQTGFADEHGFTFTGLNPSATYYVYPDDCNSCHGSMHDVVFDHWGDGSTVRPRAAAVGSTLDAWFSCTNNCA